MYTLLERPVEWIDQAPVRVVGERLIAAPPEEVFATLADHEGWPSWFPGMRSARIDGPATGVGALRTVGVGPISVQERFVSWDVGRRMSFTLTSSGAPGLASMVEDLQLEAVGTDQTRLHYIIGLAGSVPGRLLDPVLRLGARRIVSGGLSGLASKLS